MGVATINDLCGGPVIKYPTLCGGWLVSGVVFVTTGNPSAGSFFFEFGR